jgi:hypothetical protein
MPVATAGALSDVAIVIILLAALATAKSIFWPVFRAVARRIEGGGVTDLQAEVDALRSRLDLVEQQQARVVELEERLDFAERLLAQAREPERVGR